MKKIVLIIGIIIIVLILAFYMGIIKIYPHGKQSSQKNTNPASEAISDAFSTPGKEAAAVDFLIAEAQVFYEAKQRYPDGLNELIEFATGLKLLPEGIQVPEKYTYTPMDNNQNCTISVPLENGQIYSQTCISGKE